MLGGRCCLPICDSSTQKEEMGSPGASWLALVSFGFISGDPDSENKVKSNEDSWYQPWASTDTQDHTDTNTNSTTQTQANTYKLLHVRKKSWKKIGNLNMVHISNYLTLILGWYIYPVLDSPAGRCRIFTVTLAHIPHDENFLEMQCDSCM